MSNLGKFKVRNLSTYVTTITVGGTNYTMGPAGSATDSVLVPSVYLTEAELEVAKFSGLQIETVTAVAIDEVKAESVERGLYEDFYGPITNTLSTLIAAVDAADAGRNAIRTARGQLTYFTNIEAQTLEPVIVANGLDIGCDQTDGDGIGLDWGLETVNRSVSTFMAHTDKMYAKARVTIDTVAGLDFVFGFRKAEAFQKDYNNYDEMVALRLNAGALYIESILNGGATIDTDTTDTVTDGDVIDLYLEHDQTLGLAMACALANDVKSMYNTHIASDTAHTTAPDTVNVVTAADATTLVGLLALVNDMITQYVAHDDDAELGAAWLYHAAQEAGDHSLISTVPVVGISTAIVMLTDMKAKINAHIADTTAHGVATTAISEAIPSCTFFKYAVNDAVLAEPTVIAPFTFDVAEKVVPFLQYKHNVTLAGKVVINKVDFDIKQ